MIYVYLTTPIYYEGVWHSDGTNYNFTQPLNIVILTIHRDETFAMSIFYIPVLSPVSSEEIVQPVDDKQNLIMDVSFHVVPD